MNILRNIALFTMLLGTIGNSWATGELQVVGIPPGAHAELLIFITPKLVDPIPAICNEVQFIPVIALFNGNHDSTSMNGMSVEKGEISVKEGSPFVITPGVFATVTIENAGLEQMVAGWELKMFPAEALGECGPKVSVSVISGSGESLVVPATHNVDYILRPVIKANRF
jgi:hypothetical protein